MDIRELLKRSHTIREKVKVLGHELDSLNKELHELDNQINKQLDLKGKDIGDLSEEEFQLLMSELDGTVKLNVEVGYITNELQEIREIQLTKGATIQDAIEICEIMNDLNEIDLTTNKVGIFGTIKPLTEVLTEGDRVEIYRPVTAKA